MRYLKLPFQFDADRLLDDVRRVEQTWIPHFRTDHSTDWFGINLRTIGGDAANPKYHADPSVFEFTPLYEKCTYVPRVLDKLKCQQKRVRFLKLMPGGLIKRHIDVSETLLHGEVRLHVPVITDPGIKFYVAGKRLIMRPGELWYVNTLHRHWIHNPTDVGRIHLVIDCVVNDFILNLVKHNCTQWEFAGEQITYSLQPFLQIKDRMLQKAARAFERAFNRS